MIADMLSNNNLNSIVTNLFIKGRKLNISLVFVTQSYFGVPKYVRQNSTHYFILKFQTKKNFNKFQDFLNLYKKCTVKLYSFLVIDANLVSDNLSRFRKNLLERI